MTRVDVAESLLTVRRPSPLRREILATLREVFPRPRLMFAANAVLLALTLSGHPLSSLLSEPTAPPTAVLAPPVQLSR